MSSLEELDEEARGLLRRVLESLGYRQRSAANIRGHGLKLLPDVTSKQALLAELHAHLGAVALAEELHGAAGGEDPYDRFRERMERIPYPTTRMDLSACLALTEKAEAALSRAYVESRVAPLADLAGRVVAAERPFTQGELERFVAFAQEPDNRPRAQECFDRWLLLCLGAFGRPGTAGDARAVSLGLRRVGVAEVVEGFLEDVDGLRTAAGLDWPRFAVGLELTAEATQRMGLGTR